MRVPEPAIPGEQALSHVDPQGQAHMVDVGPKPETARTAVARGRVLLRASTLARVVCGDLPKGEVLPVARLAAIQAVKRTAELIPLCHPLRITGVEVSLVPVPAAGAAGASADAADASADAADASADAAIDITVRVTAFDRTGVEMEALHAVTVAALTLYDMVKAVDRGLRITDVHLVEKTGGRSGRFPAKDGSR